MNVGYVGEDGAAESADNNSKSSLSKEEEPEGRQVVLWPQFQTEEGGILSNSKVLFNFLLQSPYSRSVLGCQQLISIYSVT